MEMETQESKHAKQKASVKWILSKAFNNRVPDNVKEPFYRDHEGVEHLKPQIVVGFGNASIYCQVLSNIYSDPNYQSLNHWSILQTLQRKGVLLNEDVDTPLTETVLIQTNPLRINAHMTVIEALMILYAKEVASSGRIASALERISGRNIAPPQHFEAALLNWVSHVCGALRKRIDYDIANGAQNEYGERQQNPPDMPLVRDFRDLCDGVCLAYLISYYCPKLVPWTSVKLNYLPTVEDSIHNILLVSNFCERHLPYSVFHMTPEDITYMRGSMKQNLIVLLADLFNLCELHPAKCVCYPGMDQQSTVNRSPSGNALRKHLPSREEVAEQPDENFVVHKSKGVPTLSSMQEPLVPARLRQSKEKSNNDSKAEERGDSIPAGRPSNWEESRRTSYSGRRSRRNSLSEESQLTIENFGGSQDQLNLIGRFDRERKVSNVSAANVEQAMVVRSSLADARGSIQFGYDTDSGTEKQDRDTEKTPVRRTNSNNVHSIEKDNVDGDMTGNFGPTALQAPEEHTTPTPQKRKTSFATLPANTTTWQQQAIHVQKHEDHDEMQPVEDVSKISTIKLKLEEKRRSIEQEKRRMETAYAKQLQTVGKAAFLQAINKNKGGNVSDDSQKSKEIENTTENIVDSIEKSERPCSLKDLEEKQPRYEQKWEPPVEALKSPDLDHMDIEQYQQSINKMNTNLHDIQADIQRLTQQQNQIHAQTIQAQQLLQAQQIANLLNQQYGSQQNLNAGMSGGYRTIPNQLFASSPHLPQSQQSPINQYGMRPPSRDSYTPQSVHHQFINDQGQYMSPQQQPPPQPSYNNYQTFTREQQSQAAQMISENGQFRKDLIQYSSNQHLNMEPQQYYQDSNHYRDSYMQPAVPPQQEHNQFFLHDTSSPQPPQRRTWAQSAAANQQINNNNGPMEVNAWQQNKSPNHHGGFSLHQQNGGQQSFQNLFEVHQSPQHTKVHKQISQLINTSGSNSSDNSRASSGHHDYRDNRIHPRSPPMDDMAPQSISFIGDEDSGDVEVNMSSKRASESMYPVNKPKSLSNTNGGQDLDKHLSRLNITSGNRTYRIPSPTRPTINANSFSDPNDDVNEKGFYISFDNEQPKRPKPPLRMKRSPKKEKSVDSDSMDISSSNTSLKKDIDSKRENNFGTYSVKNANNYANNYDDEPIMTRKTITDNSATFDMRKQHNLNNNHNNNNFDIDMQPQQIREERKHLEDVTNQNNQMHHYNNNSNSNNISSISNNSHHRENKIVIGTDTANLDPNSIDEMEKKKEKIMLLSLQRRQQQEEAKARKEFESMQRREKEREKEEEKVRKKEEQAARRQQILEAHKLKKAVEEAEREGKQIDRDLLIKHQQHQQQIQQNTQAAKMRPQKLSRPRPKTIHVETGSIDLSEVSLGSRGKKGSSTNLTGIGLHSSNSMRRDYYRGSQDSLAIREPTIERGRTLSRISIARGANFRGRKSNSLMNLCDSDSGLGRATPPRRAPSPGMGGSGRHLPSPSGPGSLPPGLMTKRRVFDDGSSDISSNASSMMDYNGPRLYKQPATKSNRGIILNAVEYCVFPGAVNREAKQKVLEKIARSEAKHFLVLFRDAGCQFRALYGYWPENETIIKLYGTGPSQVDDVMFDKFFKYNSGGKCFSQVHTKHLTVTIDAFTIHNSLWQGKKANLPSKKDMALVI